MDQGLQTGLTPGMKLEVCVRSEAENPYWVANIITTCGQLLLLRYEGYQDDRRADFWCDIMTADLHPLGWSRQHGKTMRAPEGEAGQGSAWSSVFCFESYCLSCNLLTDTRNVGVYPVELISHNYNKRQRESFSDIIVELWMDRFCSEEDTVF